MKTMIFLNGVCQKALRFLRGKDGASAIEYAIIAGLIALAIIVGATAVGGGINNLFTDVSDKLDEVGTNLPAVGGGETPPGGG